ncbi:phosphotransacetylase family protein [Plectonema cf. radiosum LEGE 06105]|uniref:Phosphotransacetylase family protein n=1 Tax=Plectonema cf. radiosum LEGE 06105 TaxID=945769 RepID=A0A8J7F1F2_9CYAN|nr:phosphotransacetylase family protein [Plectonema radiosum]MBE9214326.1 phosphotransacetylase family protein [Plectonema cf. radiosum LEGE 06105]
MPKSPKYLLIGSTEPSSGKSAIILGLSDQLHQAGLDLAYGKPLGKCLRESEESLIEKDVEFITQSLNLAPNRVVPTLLGLNETTLQKRLCGQDTTNYSQSLTSQYLQNTDSDLVILEGPGNLSEGRLFDLSLVQLADLVDAEVLLVFRYKSLFSVETLLSAKQLIGERLIGVVLNDVPASHLQAVNNTMRPFLEQQGIPVFGILPKSNLLRSVTVGELVHQLNAQVLCRDDRLNLLVESLAIGAMNVNAAVKYFRKRQNMAVVTGGDRVEIQQAALETSTQCLILTGQLPPPSFILTRAEELEIPILSVDLDTLSTVEIIERAFGQVRVHEPIKAECVRHLMREHFDINRLLSLMDLSPATTRS